MMMTVWNNMHLYELIMLSLIFGVWVFGIVSTCRELIKLWKEDEK